ncbi:MAG: aminopeptidase [Clostridia bacterium]|nr:aminopeptidase [Clostridia bacterium]
MNKEEILTKYAELVLLKGVSMQRGQGVEIVCPVERNDVAKIFAKTAFSLGARDVSVRYEDRIIDKYNYLYGDKEYLSDIPKWKIMQRDNLLKKNYCYVAIDGDDPSVFKDVPVEKLAYIKKARAKAFKKFSDEVMKNGIRWCVVSIPTESWAKEIFKNDKNAVDKLWELIIKSMRLDSSDPVSAWTQHVSILNKRAEFLNAKRFSYLEYKNKSGTDIKVGLIENHVWLSAEEKAQDGVKFIANMPTEEVFTAPHNKRIDGTVRSALPLSYNGQIIDDFTITFKKGKIVSVSAKKGEDLLKKLIETDSGTKSLGEVALIGKNSPIALSNVLFYNTLFDENASCHFAIGGAYPTTVKNGDTLSKKELHKLGFNDSKEHVDFMIGTKDLNITGVQKDGTRTPIFIDGDWVI